MEKLISFDLRADFGFLKKPDVNDGLQLSYNMLHKPALLGILGAIAGLRGYEERGKFPEYYERLKHLRVGIQPIGAHERGNFARTLITFTNTVGYANKDKDGNPCTMVIYENTLVKPAYRVFLLLDTADELQRLLAERIGAGWSEFVPYLGKNEFHAWWCANKVRVWDWKKFQTAGDFKVDSLFIREHSTPLRERRKKPKPSFVAMSTLHASSFAYFERLPHFFREEKDFVQYELAEFAYTDWVLQPTSEIEDLFELRHGSEPKPLIVQLF